MKFFIVVIVLFVVHQSFSMDELMEAYASGGEVAGSYEYEARPANTIMPVMDVYFEGEVWPIITAEIRLENQKGLDMLLSRYIVFYNKDFLRGLGAGGLEQRAGRRRRFEEIENDEEESILV